MATKRQYCKEMFGLWDDTRGMLPNLAGLVDANALLTTNNHALKVLGEALNILSQDIPSDTIARITMLESRVIARGMWLDNAMEFQKKSIMANMGNLDIVLTTFATLPVKVEVRNMIDKDRLATLRLTNVHKANTHVLDSIAKGRVSPGSNGNANDLPTFTFGQNYRVKGHKQEVQFKAVSEKNWTVLNGDKAVSSAEYPDLTVKSWTMVGKILRCTKADYTGKKDGVEFTVPQGNLNHPHFKDIKAGGITPLSVEKIE